MEKVIGFLRKNIIIVMSMIFIGVFSANASAQTISGGSVNKGDIRAPQYTFTVSNGNGLADGYLDLYLYIPKYLDTQSNEFNMSLYNHEPIIDKGEEYIDRIEYSISKNDVETFSKENIKNIDYMPIKYEKTKAHDAITGEKIDTKEIKILKLRMYLKNFSANKSFAITIPIAADLDNEFKDTLIKKSYAKSIITAKEGLNVKSRDIDIEFETTPVELSFDLDGGQGDIKSQIMARGDKAREVEKATKDGALFVGWYDGEDEFDFSKEVTKDTVLKAKWEKSYDVLVKYVDEKGKILKEIPLKGKLGEKYTTKEEKIDGYKLNSKPENAEGIFTEEKQEVVYRYEKEKKSTGSSSSGGGSSSYNPIIDPEVTRISGKDRVETAVEFSKETFGKSKYIIVADGKNFADPLVSTTLAARLKAPILLTVGNNIEEVVKNEIKRLGAREVIIVGGPKSVSDSKKYQLKEFDSNEVERVYGHNRYDTSVNLSEKLIAEFGVSKDKAILVSGEIFADVLSVSPYSIKINRPILLTTVNKLPESINSYIDNRKLDEILLVGGEATISSKLKDNIDSKVKKSRRIAGSNRYETSVLIANEGFKNDQKAYITSGEVFADGLVSGAASFKGEEKPIILTREDLLLDVTKDYLKNSDIRQLMIVGGVDRVGRDLELELKNIVESK
ncbi:MAG: cell wall-binding repeat-containing protein [Peptostreptococcus sp.]|uniref:cell wall-binding repeat-containing protein n=1 Tax=Peptostreptococcus sp. TaxID=1262 RepID=UPI002FC86E9E